MFSVEQSVFICVTFGGGGVGLYVCVAEGGLYKSSCSSSYFLYITLKHVEYAQCPRVRIFQRNDCGVLS